VQVHIEDMKTGRKHGKIFEVGDLFIIEPYEKHTLVAIEDSEWVALFSEQINNSDVFKE